MNQCYANEFNEKRKILFKKVKLFDILTIKNLDTILYN